MLKQSCETNKPSADFKALFDTEHLEADLKGRTIRGGTVTLASQGFRFALQMGSTVVLARLLTPADYGLVGMTSVVTGFIELFRDLGLSEATIQHPTINHRQVSTLFWLNCLVGLGLMLVVIGLSPLVARFYQEPRVTGIMSALSINFLLSSTAVQHAALLKRQMKFTVLAMLNVVSMAMGVIVAVVSAQMGAGYWALVLMYLTSVMTYSAGCWATCRWRPGKPDFNSKIGAMLRFGGNLTGFNVVNYLARNLDNVLIGRVWGSVELGLYAKAYQLILLPINQINTPVTSVAMPALSRLQNQPRKYERYYYKAILLLTSVSMPIVCFLYVAADSLILILLGERWIDTVTIFRILMPAAFVGTFNVADGWVFQSLDKTDRQFRWGIFSSLVRVISFVVAVRWGAIGMASAFSISSLLLLVPRFIYCYQGTPLKLAKLFGSLFRPTISSVGSALITMVISQSLNLWVEISLITLLVQLFIYALFYILTWTMIPSKQISIREVLAILKK